MPTMHTQIEPVVPNDEYLRERYPEVENFTEHMRFELWMNRLKGDQETWLKCNPRDLCFDLSWHHIKLMAALKENNFASIIEHAADVANLAMMVCDSWQYQHTVVDSTLQDE